MFILRSVYKRLIIDCVTKFSLNKFQLYYRSEVCIIRGSWPAQAYIISFSIMRLGSMHAWNMWMRTKQYICMASHVHINLSIPYMYAIYLRDGGSSFTLVSKISQACTTFNFSCDLLMICQAWPVPPPCTSLCNYVPFAIISKHQKGQKVIYIVTSSCDIMCWGTIKSNIWPYSWAGRTGCVISFWPS